MPSHTAVQDTLHPKTQAFYRRALMALHEAGIGFLVGGAYAFAHYTGIVRDTKDFDIFVRRSDFEPVLDLFEAAGYQTENTFPYWLGKALWKSDNIDVIFNSGNGVTPVDDAWFEHADESEILGMPLKICPAEEVIWSKALVMARERYDGADVAHLLYARGRSLDWRRLLDRFGPHWRVLFSHLLLFGFIYPSERSEIPKWVMNELIGHLQAELNSPPATERVCYGTLLSWDQYLVDVEQHGYQDGLLIPPGTLSAQDCAHMTAVLKAGQSAAPRSPADRPPEEQRMVRDR